MTTEWFERGTPVTVTRNISSVRTGILNARELVEGFYVGFDAQGRHMVLTPDGWDHIVYVTERADITQR